MSPIDSFFENVTTPLIRSRLIVADAALGPPDPPLETVDEACGVPWSTPRALRERRVPRVLPVSRMLPAPLRQRSAVPDVDRISNTPR